MEDCIILAAQEMDDPYPVLQKIYVFAGQGLREDNYFSLSRDGMDDPFLSRNGFDKAEEFVRNIEENIMVTIESCYFQRTIW